MTDGINWKDLDINGYKTELEKRTKEKYKNESKLFTETKVDSLNNEDWENFAEIISTNKTSKAKVDSDDTDEEKEDKGLLQFLLKLFSADVVIAKFDENGNGKLDKGELSASELKDFVKQELAGLDGDAGDLSLDDIAAYLDKYDINLDTNKAENPTGAPGPTNPPNNTTTYTTLGWAEKSGAELTNNIQTADMQFDALLYSTSDTLATKNETTQKAYGESFDKADPNLVNKMNTAATEKETARTTLNKLAETYSIDANTALGQALNAYMTSMEQLNLAKEQQAGLEVAVKEAEAQLGSVTETLDGLVGKLLGFKHVTVPTLGETPTPEEKNAYYAAIKRNKAIDKQKAEVEAQIEKLKAEKDKLAAEHTKLSDAKGQIDASVTTLETDSKTKLQDLEKCEGYKDNIKTEYTKALSEYDKACKTYTAAKKEVMESIKHNLEEARKKEKTELLAAKQAEIDALEEENKKFEAGDEATVAKYNVPENPPELRKSLDAYQIATAKESDKYTGQMAHLNDEATRKKIIAQYGSIYNYITAISMYGTEPVEGGRVQLNSAAVNNYTTIAELNSMTPEQLQAEKNAAEANNDTARAKHIQNLIDGKYATMTRSDLETYINDNPDAADLVEAYMFAHDIQSDDEDTELAMLAAVNGWEDEDRDGLWEYEATDGTTQEMLRESTETEATTQDSVSTSVNSTGFASAPTTTRTKEQLEAEKAWIQAEQARIDKYTIAGETPTSTWADFGNKEGTQESNGLGRDDLSAYDAKLEARLQEIEAELAALGATTTPDPAEDPAEDPAGGNG